MKKINLGETIIAIVFILLIAFGAAKAIGAGTKRSERAECIKWEQQAKEYPLYYSTAWQKEQCKAQGIELSK